MSIIFFSYSYLSGFIINLFLVYYILFSDKELKVTNKDLVKWGIAITGSWASVLLGIALVLQVLLKGK